MKYLICNLKANKTYPEILDYIATLKTINHTNINLILAPPLIYLPLFNSKAYDLCAQDLSMLEALKLTGDTNIEQLKSLGVTYALIGHYDRKKYYNETEYQITQKIKNALKNNLQVIYCIGETLEELARKVEYQVLERQLARLLNNIPKHEFKNIIIAYEPTYLIGKNTPYDLNKINETITFIKKLIYNYYEENIKVVFGGNINPNNINELKQISLLDGFIIGSSCLEVKNICKIIKAIN